MAKIYRTVVEFQYRVAFYQTSMSFLSLQTLDSIQQRKRVSAQKTLVHIKIEGPSD